MKSIFELDEKEFNMEIREYLHLIKYEKEFEMWFENEVIECLENLDKLNEEEFERLCILATYIQGAFQKYKVKPIPKWSYDKRLVMEKAHLARRISPEDIFMASQSELSHNVFLGTTAFDVL